MMEVRPFVKCLALILLVSCFRAESYGGTTAPEGFVLSFAGPSRILADRYRDNFPTLERLRGAVEAARPDLLSGRAHIVLAVSPGGGDDKAVNTASVQAAVVRSYLSTEYGLPLSCFVFGFDPGMGERFRVRAEVRSGPVPAQANRSIHYTESDVPSLIARTVERYGTLPRVETAAAPPLSVVPSGPVKPDGLEPDLAVADTVGPLLPVRPVVVREDSYADTTYVGGEPHYIEGEPQNGGDRLTRREAALFPDGAVPVRADRPAARPRRVRRVRTAAVRTESRPAVSEDNRALVSVRTNLLYWCALTPNLGLKLYATDRWGLWAEGLWADWSLGGQDKKHYGLSSVCLGGSYRPGRAGGRVKGHSVDVYAQWSQFDLKFGRTGHTGDCWGGGIGYGYAWGISRGLYLEAGLRAGYLYCRYDDYSRQEGTSYLERERTRHYVGLTEARLSLVCVLGKEK